MKYAGSTMTIIIVIIIMMMIAILLITDILTFFADILIWLEAETNYF